VSVAQSVLAGSEELRKTNPRLAALRLASAQGVLERYSSTDLASFVDKRAHNEQQTLVLKAIDQLDQRALLLDYIFARKAVELLFELSLVRAECAGFDYSPLAQLEQSPVPIAREPGQKLGDVGTAIEKCLDASRGLDADVGRWGWENLPALMRGAEPVEIPVELTGGGTKALLGAFVGRGPKTRRLVAASNFKLLGHRFRERLYLLATNTLILRLVSRLAQAEEAWRRFLARDEGAERWQTIGRNGTDILEYILEHQDGNSQSAEEAVGQIGTEIGANQAKRLRPIAELEAREWEVFAMAYFFELAAIMGDLSSRDVGITGLAGPLIERPLRGDFDRSHLDRALENVRETWRARPPQTFKRDEPPA
jgi:hypothetical protein